MAAIKRIPSRCGIYRVWWSIVEIRPPKYIG